MIPQHLKQNRTVSYIHAVTLKPGQVTNTKPDCWPLGNNVPFKYRPLLKMIFE